MASKKRPFKPKQAIHLRKDYHKDPEKMIGDFCHMFTVKECRAMLWKMTCAFLGSEHSDYLNKDQRGDYMLFYELLSAFIEAGYLIDTKNQNVINGNTHGL